MAALSPICFSVKLSPLQPWKYVKGDDGFRSRSPTNPCRFQASSRQSRFASIEKLCEECCVGKLSVLKLRKILRSRTTLREVRNINKFFSRQNQKIDFCRIFAAPIAFFTFVPRRAEAAQEFLVSLSKNDVVINLQTILDTSSLHQQLDSLGRNVEHLGAIMLKQADCAMNIVLADIRNATSFLEVGHAQFSLSPSPLSHNLTSSAGHALGQIGTAAAMYSNYSFPFTTACFAAMISSAVMVSTSSPNVKPNVIVPEDTLPWKYNPQRLEAYFRKRPHKVVLRFLKASIESSTLITSILADILIGRVEQNERLRAVQFLEHIARLGPTAIKIGQALSIRPDILPKAYVEELQKLQDRVPPFSNDLAMDLVVQGLRKPAAEVFSYISEEPVAAASLGQVYKAILRETGEIVAVKVQRPGVLENISLDIFILRLLSSLMKRLPFVHTDFVDLLDNWAVRFFNELDYVEEADNAERFAKDMKGLSSVTVPRVLRQYTTQKVLTMVWVEGEKLSESKAADLLPLISTALNCYLVQLLESGFLHADPHPGNLLRTPDGRLCVLDFGLMTEVTEDQRYTLIEYIAHLINSDYAEVAEDLVRLGFVPAELVDPVKTAAIIPQVSQVLGQLVQGGGARKINMEQVTDGLTKMSKDYVFVIPPYFALILRAFSVLEGIGLEADPDYTIVDECYPYLSKRLLTDDSPRARAILKYFLYAGNKQLDVQRLEGIISGFKTFRDSMAIKGVDGKLATPVIDPTARKALLMLFAPEGSYIQELVLTELVRMVDALSRGALAELWKYSASTFLLPFPARSWLFPMRGWIVGVSRVATLSEEDLQSLEMVKRLLLLMQFEFRKETSTTGIAEVAQGVMPMFWDLIPGCTSVAQRFIVMLAQRQALRLADDLDGRRSITDWDKDPSALARQIRPVNLLLSSSRSSE
ncbi:hypothetical protein O6H91_07G029700 [Diphasiastrum complanatum]|uniref:Uncharacterized protein n=1 Tax=Diphasiastrum complanatum TaxID=34168 RepID=A0ACC2D3K8_DIPCM|nr:hypothetical protein O6H91_07G029700 [Diphasiastrum complanatum]